jgi:glutathione S-transferase kappa 1
LFSACFDAIWVDAVDISQPELFKTVLGKLFNEKQVEEILQAADDPVIKKTLTDNTDHAIKNLGAFGCPWFWVHDGKGKAEPFFGSDRWHFMWDYLDIPHQELELMPPDAKL